MIAIIGAIIFGIAAVLTLLITLGFPLGELTMGGKHRVVPPKMRIATGVSFVIQIFAIIIILQTDGIIALWFSRNITRGICFFFAGYLSLNSIMNLI